MKIQARLNVLLLAGMLLLGCSHGKTPATLLKVAGDGQLGVVGEGLMQPLVVKVVDAAGQPVAGVAVQWTVVDGGGSVNAVLTTTGDDGLAATTAKLGPLLTSNHFQAATPSWAVYTVMFQAGHSPFTLTYSDPAAGGKLRLVGNPASTATAVVLDLVVAPGAAVSAYSVGFNLPLDASKVTLPGPTALIAGKVLNPGQDPVAAMAALPANGPLKGTLVTGQSQKASGSGAVTTDTMLPAGSVLYSVKLNLAAGATPGVVFDGTVAGFVLPSAGARNRLGTAVIKANEVAVGKLLVK